MKLHSQVQTIASREDLGAFIEALRGDLQSNPQEWENHTLDRYLQALSGWLADSPAFYENKGQDEPATPSWKNVAEMLISARIYE